MNVRHRVVEDDLSRSTAAIELFHDVRFDVEYANKFSRSENEVRRIRGRAEVRGRFSGTAPSFRQRGGLADPGARLVRRRRARGLPALDERHDRLLRGGPRPGLRPRRRSLP
jgi:hypothetical protein